MVSHCGIPEEAAPGHTLWGLYHIGLDGTPVSLASRTFELLIILVR